MYPTMLAAFLCPGLMLLARRQPEWKEPVASCFMLLFAVNTVILSFEFPRMTAMFVGTLLVALALLVLLLNPYFGLIPWLLAVWVSFSWSANGSFYFGIGFTLLFVYMVMWIVTRFDYWEITPNEVIHHHGPFSDMRRFPASNLRLDVEIPDICEYLYLKCGRLILHPTSDRAGKCAQRQPGGTGY